MRWAILSSGSHGNCTAIQSDVPDAPIVLLDCGITKSDIFLKLKSIGWDPGAIRAILLTHEHTDHVRGLQGMVKRFPSIDVVGSAGTLAALPYLKEHGHLLQVDPAPAVFSIGGLSVLTSVVPHDAAEPIAYAATDMLTGESFAYVMDTGAVPADLVELIADNDTVFVESNYEPGMLNACKYRQKLKDRITGGMGHLSNDQVCKTLLPQIFDAESQLKNLILGHISTTANDPAIVYEGAKAQLRDLGAFAVNLTVVTGDDNGPITHSPTGSGNNE